MFKHLDRKNDDDKIILDKHLKRYLDAVSKTILLTELVILLGTTIIAALVLNGFYPYELHTKYNISIKIYFLEQGIHKVIAWSVIGIYFFFYKKLPLRKRKNIFCLVIIILTALITFGSWNVNYFGFLFIIPIVVCCPFSKRTLRIVFSSCLSLDIIYIIMQASLRQDRYNYIIGVTSITVIISFYFLARSIHKTMYNSLLDVKQYTYLTKTLSEEVAHDYLTSAFSVSSLHKDLEGNHNFKSLAFIDVDNFKTINDKYGHQIGNNILKLLVTITHSHEHYIYRYGGDEFVIISEQNVSELVNDLERIRQDFTDGSLDYYNVKATVSIGVINIPDDKEEKEYLEECDKLMYISKKTGKNKITVQNDTVAS